MFRNTISMMIRLGFVGTVAALAAVVGFASSASAYETGYGPVQLVALADSASTISCTASEAATFARAYAPQYPQIALEERVEGTSIVAFTMAQDGNVSNPSIAGTSGNQLFDRAALDAVKKSRFAPATCDGSKVAGVYGVRVVFLMRDAPTWPALAPFTLVGGRTAVK